MKEKLAKKIEEKKKAYITLEEIEKIIENEIPYIEKVNLIKDFINDGILKAVRKKHEWKNSITFFEIPNNETRGRKSRLYKRNTNIM